MPIVRGFLFLKFRRVSLQPLADGEPTSEADWIDPIQSRELLFRVIPPTSTLNFPESHILSSRSLSLQLLHLAPRPPLNTWGIPYLVSTRTWVPSQSGITTPGYRTLCPVPTLLFPFALDYSIACELQLTILLASSSDVQCQLAIQHIPWQSLCTPSNCLQTPH